MAKENLNLCPERNIYVVDAERKITEDQQDSVNFERTPVLDPNLRWVIPAQENCAVKMNITGVGERISRRIWAAGLDDAGKVVSVRSLSVATLRAMGLGLVKEGVAAPIISYTLNEDGDVRTAPGTHYIRAMEDTTWIIRENDLYIVASPIVLKPFGSSEVYRAKFKDGKMQVVDGHVELETTNMKFYQRLADPTAEEAKIAKDAIIGSVGDCFYPIATFVEYGEYKTIDGNIFVRDIIKRIDVSSQVLTDMIYKKLEGDHIKFYYNLTDGFSFNINRQYKKDVNNLNLIYTLYMVVEINFKDDKIGLLYKIEKATKELDLGLICAELLGNGIDLLKLQQKKPEIGKRLFSPSIVALQDCIGLQEYVGQIRHEMVTKMEKLIDATRVDRENKQYLTQW